MSRDIPTTAPRELAPFEMNTLRLLADGNEIKEMAEALYVSERTVKNHVKRVMEKLRARNRPHAVSLGYQLGLLTPSTLPSPEVQQGFTLLAAALGYRVAPPVPATAVTAAPTLNHGRVVLPPATVRPGRR